MNQGVNQNFKQFKRLTLTKKLVNYVMSMISMLLLQTKFMNGHLDASRYIITILFFLEYSLFIHKAHGVTGPSMLQNVPSRVQNAQFLGEFYVTYTLKRHTPPPCCVHSYEFLTEKLI